MKRNLLAFAAVLLLTASVAVITSGTAATPVHAPQCCTQYDMLRPAVLPTARAFSS